MWLTGTTGWPTCARGSRPWQAASEWTDGAGTGTRIIVAVPRTGSRPQEGDTHDSRGTRAPLATARGGRSRGRSPGCLVALLARRSGFEVVAQAESVAEAIAEAARFTSRTW